MEPFFVLELSIFGMQNRHSFRHFFNLVNEHSLILTFTRLLSKIDPFIHASSSSRVVIDYSVSQAPSLLYGFIVHITRFVTDVSCFRLHFFYDPTIHLTLGN